MASSSGRRRRRARGPPPGPRRPLRPVRGRLDDARCRWRDRERRRLRGAGRAAARVSSGRRGGRALAAPSGGRAGTRCGHGPGHRGRDVPAPLRGAAAGRRRPRMRAEGSRTTPPAATRSGRAGRGRRRHQSIEPAEPRLPFGRIQGKADRGQRDPDRGRGRARHRGRLELVDRWIVAAEAEGCRFVLVANKSDLPSFPRCARERRRTPARLRRGRTGRHARHCPGAAAACRTAQRPGRAVRDGQEDAPQHADAGGRSPRGRDFDRARVGPAHDHRDVATCCRDPAGGWSSTLPA